MPKKSVVKVVKKIDLSEFPPVATPEEEATIRDFYDKHKELQTMPQEIVGTGDRKYRTGEPWIQTYTGRRFTPTNPVMESIVIEDIAHALSQICRYTGHSKRFYCVTPDTKILTNDLVWKTAGSLSVGDSLVGFDENTGEEGIISEKGSIRNNRKSRRKMKHSTVLHTGLIKRHVYALHLSDGTILKSSEEHPWLICSKKSKNQKWESTKDIINAINKGKQRFLLKFLDPWSNSHSSYEAEYINGYLSGIFDGEGILFCDRRGFLVSVSQKSGPVLEKIKYCLDYFEVKYTEYSSKKYHVIQITGTWHDKLSFLGKIQPIRLIEKYKKHLINNEWRKEFNSIKMLSIIKYEYLGVQDVVALETSSRTYFAEGFGAHNSVAEHSVMVSYLGDPKYGLLHDASEAYICDISSPIKSIPQFNDYRNMEAVLQAAIYKRFGLNEDMPASVKKADLIMLSTEANCLMDPLHSNWVFKYDPLPITVKGLSPKKAKQLFLKRFYELFDIS